MKSAAWLGERSGKQGKSNPRIESEAKAAATSGFDLDAAIDEDVTEAERVVSPLSLEDLDLVIHATGVLPRGIEIQTMGTREYSYVTSGMPEHVRITTDAAYYEQHSDSVELWSPGNPLFPAVEMVTEEGLAALNLSIRDLLVSSRSATGRI